MQKQMIIWEFGVDIHFELVMKTLLVFFLSLICTLKIDADSSGCCWLSRDSAQPDGKLKSDIHRCTHYVNTGSDGCREIKGVWLLALIRINKEGLIGSYFNYKNLFIILFI